MKGKIRNEEELQNERAKQAKEFDETKEGVKGLIDRGATEIPELFKHPPESLSWQSPGSGQRFEVPVIDLEGADGQRRGQVVRQIKEAAEEWGFFQMLNHGVPYSAMEMLLEGIRGFHEQAVEEKMKWYSRDPLKKVKFYSNGNLHILKTAGWRDSISFDYQNGHLHPNTYPLVCREGVEEYIKGMRELRERVGELLSEAIGMERDYLRDLECMNSEVLVCHYYPPCPQPELTLGATKHSDPSALTILLQDPIGGLQLLHRNHWLDISPLPGALLANIGDLLQLITNDKIKSVEHRVLTRRKESRVSAACFFYPKNKLTQYSPGKEFQSQQNPPKYRPTNFTEYHSCYVSKGLDGNSALPFFKISYPQP